MKNKKSKEKTNIINKKCNIDIFINILYAVVIQLYFISLNINNILCTPDIADIYIKISYTIFVFIAILIFEVAYKKDNGITAIYGIEFLVLAIHILLIERITNLFSFNKILYITATSYIWPIYYCFKSIIIRTKENREEIKKTSDIEEIVKEEKPIKKVAKKRKK